MSAEIQFDSDIQWDGNHLSVWAVNKGARILCGFHAQQFTNLPPSGDVLTREIARDRVEIFDRLRATLTAKIVRESSSPVELRPTDLTA